MNHFARLLSASLILCLVDCLAPAAEPAQGYPHPVLDPQAGFTTFSIPPAAKAPTLDGNIDTGEWDNAFEINVMGNQQLRPAWVFLYNRWVKWRMTWDADNLYLCSQSQRLPRENLVVNLRDRTTGGQTVLDDSIEIHFSPIGRNVVGTKLPWAAQSILNPAGVGFFSKFTWSVAARTTTWVPDWKIGSKIHDDSWVIEVAIPRSTLDLEQPNKAGDDWSILMARNWKRTGWNQSTLPGKLTSFAVPREQPVAYLSDGPYAQLQDVSKLFAGDVHTQLKVGNAGKAATKATVKLEIEQLPAFKPAKTTTAPAVEEDLYKFQKQDELTIEPGQSTPWTVNEPGKLQKGKTYRYHIVVTAAGSKNPLLETNFFVVPGSDEWIAEASRKIAAASKDYDFRASIAPTKNLLQVYADYLYSPTPADVTGLNVQLFAEGEAKPLLEKKSLNLHDNSITDAFALPTLKPGKYPWKAQLIDKAGKAIASGEGVIERKDEAAAFPWWNFQGGDTEKVLWPYEPIKVLNGGAEVGYWGGRMFLDGLCLPRQLQVTANEEQWPALLRDRPSVLSRRIQITAKLAGKPAPVDMQGFPRTTDVKDHKASMRGYGSIGRNIELQSDATLWQDGLLWITLTLRPGVDSNTGKDVPIQEAVLDELTIDIPLRAEVARLMNAYGQPGYGSFKVGSVPDGNGVVWDCTSIGKSIMIEGDMVPLVWLGNEQRGLVFLAENNIGWSHNATPDQQILRNAGEVVLRLNIIQQPVTLRQGEDRRITLGFLPTPMRKMVPGWRMLNCSFSQNFADSFQTGRSASAGNHNSSYFPSSYGKSRPMMFTNTKGMISMAGGSEFAPHTERGGYESRTNDAEAMGYFNVEWSQNTYTREFQNHLFYGMQKWMDKGGLTGIYQDQFYASGVTNCIGGAAWKLPDGRTNQGYNLRLDRQYDMRMSALMLENGIQPRIFCHTTNGGQLISFPWVTAILDGEDNMIVSNADYDFCDIYPPARMQAFGNPWPWGNTFYWMRLIQDGDANWRKAQDRAYQGWTIVHDVMFGHDQLSHRPAMFEWGMNDGRVQFWPYWRSKDYVHSSDPGVLVSMWTLPDRAMVVAFNTNKKKAASVSIRLPLADLGLMPKVRSEYLKAADLEGNDKFTFDAWEGQFNTVTIPPHDFRILSVRKYQD